MDQQVNIGVFFCLPDHPKEFLGGYLHNDPARIPESQVKTAMVEWTRIQVNMVFCLGMSPPKISPYEGSWDRKLTG
jgi:hypothetical protein